MGWSNSDPPFPTQWFPILPAFWTLVSPPQLYLITGELQGVWMISLCFLTYIFSGPNPDAPNVWIIYNQVTKWPHSQNVGEYHPLTWMEDYQNWFSFCPFWDPWDDSISTYLDLQRGANETLTDRELKPFRNHLAPLWRCWYILPTFYHRKSINSWTIFASASGWFVPPPALSRRIAGALELIIDGWMDGWSVGWYGWLVGMVIIYTYDS